MTPSEQVQARLDAFATRLEPRLHAAFLKASAAYRDVELRELLSRLEAGSVDEVVGWLLDQPSVATELRDLRARYADAVVTTTARETAELSRILRVRVIAPAADAPLIEAIRRFENGAFRNIVKETQLGLRELVANEIERGLGPRHVAVALKSGVASGGLTQYDADIIRSFRKLLEEGRYREALKRALRDKRSDRTLERLVRDGKRLSSEQIDRMVANYQRGLVDFRAETFARTNAIQAANEATIASWRAAVEQGAVPLAEVRRYWIVAQDERLCERCKRVVQLNPDGVGLEEWFVIDDQGATAFCPPLHPNCRCTVWIRRVRAGVRQRSAPGLSV